VGFEDLRIRDVSRLLGEWSPPIGALGGPPAHELYRDLVVYAGLQLFRDARSRPWVTLRDGAHRHAFAVPSAELRGALDRFRMRRNVRPLPESDIDEFVRIINARASDPDVEIPTLKAPVAEPSTAPESGAPARREVVDVPPPSGTDSERAPLAARVAVPAVAPPVLPADPTPPPAPRDPTAWAGDAAAEPPINSSISGGYRFAPLPDPSLARYVRVFRRLVHDGDWMGTTRELADLTRDDPFTLYTTLLRYRSELAKNDILLASVEAGDGYRWLAVDRSKFRNPEPAPAPLA
jgi:hypothetical protein